MRDAYREAGVDIAAGNEAASRYARLAEMTRRPEVLAAIGGFSGGFRLDLARYPEPVLLSGADGVGTKLKIAFATGRHESVGIDCVAMCVNDILTSGAEPLFFLDYLATGKLDVGTAEAVVAGVAAGCQQAGCALIGGETAEMPGMYGDGEYDLAGFAVGVVNAPDLIDGRGIQAGDVIVGLASDGLHSNGFSLVRKLVAEAGLAWNQPFPVPADSRDEETASTALTAAGKPTSDSEAAFSTRTVADELLTPTRIYVRPIRAALDAGLGIKGMAHITGGGLIENVPRCLPPGLTAELWRGAWPVPPVFTWLLEQSGLPFSEAARIWNMGIGYALVVSESEAARALDLMGAAGERAFLIGRIVEGSGGTRIVEGQPA
jgi:phosphoribosylformylglycinamidine cyclo-ligase